MVKEYTLESLTTLWEDYLQKYGRKQDLLEVANAFPDRRSLTVDYRQVAQLGPEAAGSPAGAPSGGGDPAGRPRLNRPPATLRAPIPFRLREFPAELADERV